MPRFDTSDPTTLKYLTLDQARKSYPFLGLLSPANITQSLFRFWYVTAKYRSLYPEQKKELAELIADPDFAAAHKAETDMAHYFKALPHSQWQNACRVVSIMPKDRIRNFFRLMEVTRDGAILLQTDEPVRYPARMASAVTLNLNSSAAQVKAKLLALTKAHKDCAPYLDRIYRDLVRYQFLSTAFVYFDPLLEEFILQHLGFVWKDLIGCTLPKPDDLPSPDEVIVLICNDCLAQTSFSISQKSFPEPFVFENAGASDIPFPLRLKLFLPKETKMDIVSESDAEICGFLEFDRDSQRTRPYQGSDALVLMRADAFCLECFRPGHAFASCPHLKCKRCGKHHKTSLCPVRGKKRRNSSCSLVNASFLASSTEVPATPDATRIDTPVANKTRLICSELIIEDSQPPSPVASIIESDLDEPTTGFEERRLRLVRLGRVRKC